MNDREIISEELRSKKLLSGSLTTKIHFFENLTNENSENRVLFGISSSLIMYNFSSGFIVNKYNFSSKIIDYFVDSKTNNVYKSVKKGFFITQECNN